MSNSIRDIEFDFRAVRFDSEEYRSTVELRDRILRKPLGLVFDPELLAQEEGDFHLACFDSSDRVLACLILTPEGESVRMRQVAVDSTLQRSGIGTELVAYSEQIARTAGFNLMTLHARDTAVPFYLRLGYEVYGPPFEEVSIPHRFMRKKI